MPPRLTEFRRSRKPLNGYHVSLSYRALVIAGEPNAASRRLRKWRLLNIRRGLINRLVDPAVH